MAMRAGDRVEVFWPERYYGAPRFWPATVVQATGTTGGGDAVIVYDDGGGRAVLRAAGGRRWRRPGTTDAAALTRPPASSSSPRFSGVRVLHKQTRPRLTTLLRGVDQTLLPVLPKGKRRTSACFVVQRVCMTLEVGDDVETYQPYIELWKLGSGKQKQVVDTFAVPRWAIEEAQGKLRVEAEAWTDWTMKRIDREVFEQGGNGEKPWGNLWGTHRVWDVVAPPRGDAVALRRVWEARWEKGGPVTHAWGAVERR